MHINQLNKDITKRYQRKYWGNSTSMMKFTSEGYPLFSTSGAPTWTKLGAINRAATDWQEINLSYEKVEPIDKELKFIKKKSAMQVRIDQINKELNLEPTRIDKSEYPDILDIEGWKKLWNQGMEVEARFSESANTRPWTLVKRGKAFDHEPGDIHFRRKAV